MKRTNKHAKKSSKTQRVPGEIVPVSSTGHVMLEDNDGNMVKVHVGMMYMQTFRAHERRPDQTEINHIDGDVTNNSPDNLRWASPMENEMYKFN